MSDLKKGLRDFKIMGLSLPIYLIIAVILVVATVFNTLPQGMISAMAILMVFGSLLDLIGNNTPIIKTFFGGGPIVIIFVSAYLAWAKIIPPAVTKNIVAFMKDAVKIGDNKAFGAGFLDFYIAALIVGSILGMSRKLLIKAAIRYLPCILGATAAALGLVALVGYLFGMTPGETIAYIGIPIMGGGMGAGAVPISQVFSNALKIPTDQILSKLVPAVALGNAFAIVFGGLLNKVGKIKPSWTGNGEIMPMDSDDAQEFKQSALSAAEEKPQQYTLSEFGVGIVISTTFFIFGGICAALWKMLVPKFAIHTYAWMIIAVAIVKAVGIMPERYEQACSNWYQFVAKNWTSALLFGIGVAYTNFGDILKALTPEYVVLCLVVVLGAIIGGALVGKLVGFYPIESAITAGLCMANMGGTGDVAVLMAAHRMKLMPFAQISSRLGGAFIILLATFLVPIFFG